jgi:hypothetical protein
LNQKAKVKKRGFVMGRDTKFAVEPLIKIQVLPRIVEKLREPLDPTV